MDSFSAVKQNLGWHINLGHTAVLVIDMLNDFLTDGGKMVLPGGSSIVPRQKAVITAARSAGLPVVYINDAHRLRLKSTDREFKKRGEHCIEGSWGAAVIDDLTPEPEDILVTKRRFSGFFNTDLDLTLKDADVDTLIFMGVVTNICVRSTVHDAFFHGYSVIVAEDCVAATGPREQESSLYDIATHFGEITDSDTIIKALSQLKEK
ncbi:isochorismatase family cysteine hydrolase [Desulfobacula sp.]|uniref:cysteine hydrolase family protein n=1 Tax=Desulfobacula sp. TaxID=2593537 RepID=UPI00260ADC64|nr:isochorismatase family cysteine hydrolase [Desulfobacula sp.]